MIKMRMTQVAHIEDMGPHMRRIVLRGDDLEDFPADKESAHFKAIFPQPGQTKPKLGIYAGFKKWMRSYTVRAFNKQTKELMVDFAVNDHEGLGANWAKDAKQGDYLGVAGPGDTKYTNFHADWHLIMADLTALPAAAAILEKLPASAVGTAFLKVPTAKDKLPIDAPHGIEVRWLINDDMNKNVLLEGLEDLAWKDGNPAIFVAGEAGQTKAIKKQIKSKPGYISTQTYFSGYWKI
ncbi:siderophore-interacting protein [Arenicella xantha]|uniref:NADPH-dependent ferric siderophore reductase n=1 Tax=Arenicella xantha TaxID=644221 RepID=A0A395JSR7_9GAMM|nr:siderophore-interacting protein [Arenicella xantha]RBP53585.1 NADPH-dependent ferric siderophore reductase [Arenicella xantha]